MSDEIDIEHLITLVSQNPCIWDKTLEEYHSRTATTEAWRIVCSELNAQFGELSDKEKTIYGKDVIKKWRNIRDQWMKAAKKVSLRKKSGAAATHMKHYIYHEQLSFLKKSAAVNETESSYMVDDPELPASPVDNDMDQNDTPASGQTRKKPPTPAEKEGAKKKGKIDLEKHILETLKDEDPKLLFFKGILPSTKDFSDDENLQFQCGVLNLIQNIRKNRMCQAPVINLQTFPSPIIDAPQCSTWQESRSTNSHQWEPTPHSIHSSQYSTPVISPSNSDTSISLYDLDFGIVTRNK